MCFIHVFNEIIRSNSYIYCLWFVMNLTQNGLDSLTHMYIGHVSFMHHIRIYPACFCTADWKKKDRRNGMEKILKWKKKNGKRQMFETDTQSLLAICIMFFSFQLKKNETKKFDESHNIDNIYEYIVFNLLMNKYNHYKIE